MADPPQTTTTATAATTTTNAGSTTRSTSTYTPFTITSFPRVPLTTTFTPIPTDCSGIYIPTQLAIFLIHDQTTCLPDGFTTAEISFFSPGIACPSGYWSACHDNTGVPSITTVTCCPTFGSDISLSCLNPATLAGPWRSLFCTWTAGTKAKAIDVTDSAGGRTSTVSHTLSGGQGINAYGLRMVYQSSDTINPTKTGIASSESPASISSQALTSNPTGLSTGATVAIAVVIPLVVLSLAAGFFFLRRRAASQQHERQDDTAPTISREALPPKPQTYFYGGPPNHPGGPVTELATSTQSVEMSANQLFVELPADPGHRRHA